MQSPPVAELRLQATRQHLTRPSVASNPHESWIHPHLRHTIDPVKGRQLQVTQVLKKGELLLVDPPYATIPVVDEPLRNDRLLCSHFRCNRQVPCDADRISCPNRCIDDVVWCSSACHEADRERHVFECTWLQRFAPSIRSKWGEYDFGMLWLIVRMLATRAVDRNDAQAGLEQANADSRTFTTGWPAIQSFCGSSESWSHSQVRHWETLVKKYLRDGPVLPHGMPAEGVLSLICKEEANSFGLYPRATGVPLVGGPQVDRGEQFGAAVYPRAAIANHSCEPNIIHKPDSHGRMVFVAGRDIHQGEECCISYFDLAQHVHLDDRREHLSRSFRFICQCSRCVDEQAPEEEVQWDEFPSMDL